MKKTLAIVALAAVMVIGLAACGGNSLPNSITKGNLTISYPDGWTVKEEGAGGAMLGLKTRDSATITSPEDQKATIMIGDVSEQESSIESLDSVLTDQGIDHEITKVNGKEALKINTYGGTVGKEGDSSERAAIIGICTTDNGKIAAIAAVVLPQSNYDADKATYDAIIDSASVK